MRWIGAALVASGALPLLLIGAGSWMHHSYTIGLSRNAEGALIVLLAADLICLAAGLYLTTRSRSAR